MRASSTASMHACGSSQLTGSGGQWSASVGVSRVCPSRRRVLSGTSSASNRRAQVVNSASPRSWSSFPRIATSASSAACSERSSRSRPEGCASAAVLRRTSWRASRRSSAYRRPIAACRAQPSPRSPSSQARHSGSSLRVLGNLGALIPGPGWAGRCRQGVCSPSGPADASGARARTSSGAARTSRWDRARAQWRLPEVPSRNPPLGRAACASYQLPSLVCGLAHNLSTPRPEPPSSGQRPGRQRSCRSRSGARVLIHRTAAKTLARVSHGPSHSCGISRTIRTPLVNGRRIALADGARGRA